MIDVQAELDTWLASNPEAQKYVSKLWYVREGATAPPDVTHSVRLQSKTSAERGLTVGAVCVPEFAMFLDMLLASLATQPVPPPTVPTPQKT